jgi:hypothetical protein
MKRQRAVKRIFLPFFVILLVVVTTACNARQTRPLDSKEWQVIDPGGKGTVECQKKMDERETGDVLVCQAKDMEILNQGQKLSRWTVRVDRLSGEPCCRDVLPCCLKGTGCPCELFDLMRAKNVLPKKVSKKIPAQSGATVTAQTASCFEINSSRGS